MAALQQCRLLERPCLLYGGLLKAFPDANICLDTHGSNRRKENWLAARVVHIAQDEDLNSIVWQPCNALKLLSALQH